METLEHTAAARSFCVTADLHPLAEHSVDNPKVLDLFDDLVEALRAGEIAGAALDVYEIEPLPADHPLWGMPNVILTPHPAGFGPYLDDRRAEVLVDNARRFAAGEPLRNVVDKKNWF